MKKWKVIEIRKTNKEEEFVVETTYWSETKEKLREWLEKNPSKIVDKNYRIKELSSNSLSY